MGERERKENEKENNSFVCCVFDVVKWVWLCSNPKCAK